MISNSVVMVRPVRFEYNQETAETNVYQTEQRGSDVQRKALSEFNDYVSGLENIGIQVTVVDDLAEPHTPDSIFPNNWFSTHDDGTLILYPMQAKNRRFERSKSVLERLKREFRINRIVDLSILEERGIYLEGTGSVVFDRINKRIYAALSPRTALSALEQLKNSIGYVEIVAFTALDNNGVEVYHTNVIMTLGRDFCILAVDMIRDSSERQRVLKSLEGRDIILLSEQQVGEFAGNAIELEPTSGESPLIVISARGFASLLEEQRIALMRHGRIFAPSLSTIESVGGGSARCMLAENFLTKTFS